MQITLKAYQNCAKIETLDFPGKRLFGNFAKEFLQERKEKLEGIFKLNFQLIYFKKEFLNEVKEIYKENKLIVFLEFLAIYGKILFLYSINAPIKKKTIKYQRLI